MYHTLITLSTSTITTYLCYRKQYVHCDRGKKTYLEKFGLTAWFNMKQRERIKHAATNCKECLLLDEYAALKHNQPYIQANKPPPPTKTIIITKCTAHCRKNKPIPKRQKQQIIRNAFKDTREKLIPTSTTAICASKTSMKRYKELRIRLTAKYKKHNIKGHVGKLENYQFNRTLVRERLATVANGEMDLGTSMKGKWAALAREAGVKKRSELPQPKTLNIGQVSDATKPHLFLDLVLTNTNTSRLRSLKSILYIMEFEIYVSWSLLLLPTILKLLNYLRLTNTWQPLGVNECEHRSLHTTLLCSTGIDISIQ